MQERRDFRTTLDLFGFEGVSSGSMGGSTTYPHILSLASVVSAIVPLVDKHFTYPDQIPYQVDPDVGPRGSQTGYNRCNSTTEGQNSLCQTAFLNSIDDFCLWAPIDPNSLVGNVEGEMVAWCTKPGHGARTIPAGALTGVQFMKTKDYVQVVGFIDQTKVNLAGDDFGGEMDPHGADLRGNPLGGLVYSNAFGTNKNNFEQVIEWHNFIGSNFFCFKACDPAGPNAAHFCEHIYDRIGCAYNAPNNAQNGTFESCLGEDQDFPGVYVQNGVTMTYQQPPESLGPITSIPYTARVPASSSCTPFQSAQLYTGAPQATTTSGASTTGAPGTTITRTSSGTSSGAPRPSQTGNDASTLAISGTASIFGVIFAALFLA
ncbi:putative macrofage activating glycoprotein [Lyophyllum shimeji]|uniref:Macrofage activating glycoprotein n=1 Tax=Lyophyllum shimeji TaxID=47721 RepID=A0A9P3PYR9_LYOSH|nr:putative macrofage activating glycoprotein [Lyophyllum shimeji]